MFDFLDTYPYLLPLMIFFGRICDVTLGTLRIVFLSKGEKYMAPLVGFFEVFIWIVIISQILSRANDLVAYLAYAAGYATGNFVGMLIEERIAIGFMLYRIFTPKSGYELVKALNERGFGATSAEGRGITGRVDIVQTVITRKTVKDVEAIIAEFDPMAFYVVEDVRSKNKGIFIERQSPFKRWRTGK